MVLRKQKFKVKRGGPRRFTAHPPREQHPDDVVESSSDDEPQQEDDKIDEANPTVVEGDPSGPAAAQADRKARAVEPPIQVENLNRHPKPAANPGQPAPLSRREREQIEKEQARNYYLQMKEREDGERLKVIRAQREAEAARHEAAKREKELTRLQRR